MGRNHDLIAEQVEQFDGCDADVSVGEIGELVAEEMDPAIRIDECGRVGMAGMPHGESGLVQCGQTATGCEA